MSSIYGWTIAMCVCLDSWMAINILECKKCWIIISVLLLVQHGQVCTYELLYDHCYCRTVAEWPTCGEMAWNIMFICVYCIIRGHISSEGYYRHRCSHTYLIYTSFAIYMNILLNNSYTGLDDETVENVFQVKYRNKLACFCAKYHLWHCCKDLL